MILGTLKEWGGRAVRKRWGEEREGGKQGGLVSITEVTRTPCYFDVTHMYELNLSHP